VGIQYFLIFCIKFGISLTFILIYCFTTELYPTQIRGLAFGLANTFGRLATVVSALLVNVPSSFFMWLNVGQSLMIILLTFFLPETKGVKLIDKITEDNPADHQEVMGLMKPKENAIGATELLEEDTETT
jgi:uncharacterized membrane-anchored protein YitT (DUF2179 family)